MDWKERSHDSNSRRQIPSWLWTENRKEHNTESSRDDKAHQKLQKIMQIWLHLFPWKFQEQQSLTEKGTKAGGLLWRIHEHRAQEFIIQTTKELKNMLKDGRGELFWHKSVNRQAENVCLREYLKHSSQQRSTLWSSRIKERILYTSKVQKKIPWGESKNMKLISNLPLSIIKNQEWILLFFPNNRGNNPAL